jgi:hypothetical protein
VPMTYLILTAVMGLLSPVFIETWDINPEVHTLRRIQGTVLYPDESIASGVFLELYDNPNAILGDNPWKPMGSQKKIAIAKTDTKGKFRFPKVSPDKYEVRALLDQQTGANQTSVIVRVRRFWFWPLGRSLTIRYSSFI